MTCLCSSGDGKKRKMVDMLTGGGVELEPERPLKKTMEASVPPGLEQKIRRDLHASASTEAPILLSKPRVVSAVATNQSLSSEVCIWGLCHGDMYSQGTLQLLVFNFGVCCVDIEGHCSHRLCFTTTQVCSLFHTQVKQLAKSSSEC